MMTFEEEKIQEQYKIYLEKKAQREAEEKAVAEEKASLTVAWQKMKKPHVVTTQKPYPCAECNAEIPKGTKVVVRSELTNVSSRGYTWAFISKHYCSACKPVEEA